MKSLSTLRYICFSIIILGYFANFAQNEYGASLINMGLALISFSWLANIVVMGKEMWRKRGILIMFCVTILALLTSIIIFILSFLLMFGLDIVDMALAAIGVALFLPVFLIELVIIALVNQRKHFSYGWWGVIQFFGLFLLFAGFSLKLFRFPTTNSLIVISAALLIFVFLFRITGVIVKRNAENSNGRILLILLYLNAISGILAVVFKTLYLDGANLLVTVCIFFALIATVFWVVKFRFASHKKQIAINRPALLFFLVYLNYVSLIVLLTNFAIVPPFYSLAQPMALKALEKEAVIDPAVSVRADTYEKNYYHFIDSRRMEQFTREHNLPVGNSIQINL